MSHRRRERELGIADHIVSTSVVGGTIGMGFYMSHLVSTGAWSLPAASAAYVAAGVKLATVGGAVTAGSVAAAPVALCVAVGSIFYGFFRWAK